MRPGAGKQGWVRGAGRRLRPGRAAGGMRRGEMDLSREDTASVRDLRNASVVAENYAVFWIPSRGVSTRGAACPCPVDSHVGGVQNTA